jgi:uncharacterized protein YkwD
MESEVIAELNRARTNPSAFAATLDEILPRFDGLLVRREGWHLPTRTIEGAAAVREASAELRRTTPLPDLTRNDALERAARDHVADQSRTGALGHAGSDGSTVASRVARYGRWTTSINENIDYSQAVRGRDVVENLIIDDGVRDRGHRKNVYDNTSRYIGVACGPHPRYQTVCVIVQAGGMR